MREKRRKFITAILMAVIMVLGGFIPSIRANADSVEYGIWVNGEEFTSEKTSIACGESVYAVYDVDTNTITLNGGTINSYYSSGSTKALIYSESSEELTINVAADTSLVGSDLCNAIVGGGDCKYIITGTGKLTITDVSNGINTGDWNNPGDLKIKDANMDITASNYGIYSFGGLNINNSTIKITSSDFGINVDDSDVVNVDNSTVTVMSSSASFVAGDSGTTTGGLTFNNCNVNLTSSSDNAVYLWDTYDDSVVPSKTVGNFRTLTISGGGTFSASAPKGITNQTDTSKIFIPDDSVFSTEDGNGSDWSGNKMLITVGKNPVSGGGTSTQTPTPTPTPGGENGSDGGATPTPAGGDSGNGSGNGGNAAATPTPAATPAVSPTQAPDRANQKGEDGTPLGKGASFEAADSFITNYDSESDPAGTTYHILQAKATKTTKDSVKVTWKKAPGATKYYVYASKCGKNLKPKQVDSLSGTSFTLKKIDGKKISKGTYYKFIIIAVDSNNDVVASSKTVHAATMGGKVGNTKKFTTKAKKDKVSIKAKKTFNLKAKQVAEKKSLKVKNHRAVKYESTDTSVATVSAKGVIKGVAKGNCEVYVYAQNGVSKKIKVTVK